MYFQGNLVYKICYFLLTKSWCWYPLCCSSGSVWSSESSDVSWEAPFSFSGIFSASSCLQHGGHLWKAAVCFPPLKCLCEEWASNSLSKVSYLQLLSLSEWKHNAWPITQIWLTERCVAFFVTLLARQIPNQMLLKDVEMLSWTVVSRLAAVLSGHHPTATISTTDTKGAIWKK